MDDLDADKPVQLDPVETLSVLLAEQSGVLAGADVSEANAAAAAWGEERTHILAAIERSAPVKTPKGKDAITRQAVFDIAAARDSDPVPFFWAVMGWGIMGDYRQVGRLVTALQDEATVKRLSNALDAARAGVDDHDGLVKIYKSLLTGKTRISGLGPSFATKLYYFAADPIEHRLKPLICDSRTETGMAVLGYSINREKADDYARYCELVHVWADALKERHSSPSGHSLHGDIEGAIYMLGARVGSTDAWNEAVISALLADPPRRRIDLSRPLTGKSSDDKDADGWTAISERLPEIRSTTAGLKR